MPIINWGAETGMPAGEYHVEVQSSEEAFGKASGEPYFLLIFKDVGSGNEICSDILSFSPSPKAISMTLAKIRALGFTKATKNIEASDLIGRRCHVSTKVEDNPKYGPRLVVDISAPGFRAGYRAELATTISFATTSAGVAKEIDDDLPF